MTVEAFLDWALDQGGSWQLVDGQPESMAPGGPDHSGLQSEIARLLGNHLVQTRPSCQVLTEPGVIPRVRANINFRIPDLFVTCTPLNIRDWRQIEPLVIVEVLSPGNRASTWANVWTYTTVPSVREIIVVFADRIEAALLQRLPDRSWPDAPQRLTSGKTLSLPSIDYSVGLDALYRQTSLAGQEGSPGP